MDMSRSVQAATTWIRFHQAPLVLGLSLVIVCVVAVVYYMNPSHMNPSQQSFRAATENTQETPPTVPIPVSNDASIATSEVQSTTTNQPGSAVNTRLQVNGQEVPVPQTGTVHKLIKNENGNTTLEISVDANSSGSARKHSSTSIDLNSTNDSTTELNSYTRSSQ